MLNLTLPKTGTAIPVQPAGPVLADVVADIDRRENAGEVTDSTAASYRAAIRTLARKLNRPVETCPVELAEFDRLFPLDGFDPDWNRTEQGYLTWRNRTRTSLENFLGIADAKKALRDVEDGWTDLLAALEPYTKDHPTRWAIAPQKLIALKNFAQTCRAHDRQPWQVDRRFMVELETLYQGNRRTSHRTAARRMDEYRCIPEALPLLPPQPVGFAPEHHDAPLEIPAAFTAEFEPWIRAATETDWDPITRENTTKNEKHANVARAAFHTYLRCAVSEGALEAGANSCLPAFLDETRAADVARALLARVGQPKTQGGLTRRTVRKYLKTLCQVLRVAGHKPVTLEQALKANRDLMDAAQEDKEMTPENQAFCERLLARRDLRLKFLGSYLTLRRAAEAILDKAKAEGRGLTKRERSRVCILGMCACFAAIEVAGAPLRISNALGATLFGQGAWIMVPEKGRKTPIKVFIPAARTKAKKEDIRFDIKPNKFRGHETILWFVREIRPLIPGAGDNLYLFPSPRKPGAPVSDKWFRAEFRNATRSLVGLPMNPHQFRHGQASLLLNKHPEEVVVIAKRTGHTVDSLLRFYAFIEALTAMERGQDLMMGLIDD